MRPARLTPGNQGEASRLALSPRRSDALYSIKLSNRAPEEQTHADQTRTLRGQETRPLIKGRLRAPLTHPPHRPRSADGVSLCEKK